jgi:APA family basic amino acid/polyamine antiporter
MEEQQGELKREIGLFGFSANIINTIIGAGIFVIPAIVAGELGSASIFAYVFCSILLMLMMLNFAEVGSKIVETGGVYIFIERSFGKYPGFLTAVLMLLATVAADAAIANAVVSIAYRLFPQIQSELLRISFFLVLFAGLGYINIKGLKKGVGVVMGITLIKLVPLLLIIFIGFLDIDFTNLMWDKVPSFEKIGSASLILYFAYTGAGSAISVNGEVMNPQKTIPRAILLSVIVISVVYILVQTVAQGVLGDALPQFVENPLGEVASKIFGPIGFTLLTIGAGVSMFGGISSKVLSVPRLLYAASLDNVLPFKALAKVHPKFATPYVSIIVYVSLGFILATIGGLKHLLVVSSATSLILSMGVAFAAIKLRRDPRYNMDKNAFKIPGGYTVPILSILATLWFLSNMTYEEVMSITYFIIVLTVLYFLINSKRVKRIFVP